MYLVPKKKQSSHYLKLKKKWLKRHKTARENLHKKHKEAFDYIVEKFPGKERLATSAVGLLMLSSVIPTSTVLVAAEGPQSNIEIKHAYSKDRLLGELSLVVPDKPRELSDEEEAKIADVLSKGFGMDVKPDIGGLRLNRTYGVIGAEQHLMRYPGDTMATHLPPELQNDKMIYSSGMAPGRGAWGYFARSREDMGQNDVEREKWYIAVQTFEAPNYNERLKDYRDFFKYRKMLVVNTETGQAVVCDIGDAGPAVWTGKHLGGSPEVMYNLGLGKGSRKGPVLYFFIDDPGDTIPLGPINL